MSLSKRLEEAVREGRASEVQADRILEERESLWQGKQQDGQLLLFAPRNTPSSTDVAGGRVKTDLLQGCA